jgi:hypothetical protein
MSELTTCNYCSLREVKARARKEKKKVTMLPGRTFGVKHSETGGMRGIDVYVHPAKINVSKLRPDQREKYWDRWFWELSDRCVC